MDGSTSPRARSYRIGCHLPASNLRGLDIGLAAAELWGTRGQCIEGRNGSDRRAVSASLYSVPFAEEILDQMPRSNDHTPAS